MSTKSCWCQWQADCAERTFWDYQRGAGPQDRGLRIDHALLSAELTNRLVSTAPDRMERDRAQPSDHVPVVVEVA